MRICWVKRTSARFFVFCVYDPPCSVAPSQAHGGALEHSRALRPSRTLLIPGTRCCFTAKNKRNPKKIDLSRKNQIFKTKSQKICVDIIQTQRKIIIPQIVDIGTVLPGLPLAPPPPSLRPGRFASLCSGDPRAFTQPPAAPAPSALARPVACPCGPRLAPACSSPAPRPRLAMSNVPPWLQKDPWTGIGKESVWGFSPALDLLDVASTDSLQNAEEIQILLTGASDCRHLLKTLAKSRRHTTKPIKFILHEPNLRTHARHLMFLQVQPPSPPLPLLGICSDIEDSRAIQAPRRSRSNMYMFECTSYSGAPQPRRGHIAESRCTDRTNG